MRWKLFLPKFQENNQAGEGGEEGEELAHGEALEEAGAAEEVVDLGVGFSEEFKGGTDKSVEDEKEGAEAAGLGGEGFFLAEEIEDGEEE